MKQINKTEFIRVEKTSNYTVIHNQFLKRKDLSWKAKGILAYVLSLPDDWNINLKEIIKHATDGEKSFRSGWKELKEAGYVSRHPIRESKTKKISHWETVVRESVDVKASEPLTQKLHVGKVDVGKVDVGNGNLLSTKELSTKELSTKDTNKDHSPAKAEPDIPFKKIVNHLNEAADRNYRHSTGKTKSLIKARWNEGFSVEDFEKVIDNKVAQWKNDSEMEKYLRPETLFGTKFEGYLNEKPIGGDRGGSYGGLEF